MVSPRKNIVKLIWNDILYTLCNKLRSSQILGGLKYQILYSRLQNTYRQNYCVDRVAERMGIVNEILF